MLKITLVMSGQSFTQWKPQDGLSKNKSAHTLDIIYIKGQVQESINCFSTHLFVNYSLSTPIKCYNKTTSNPFERVHYLQRLW